MNRRNYGVGFLILITMFVLSAAVAGSFMMLQRTVT